ncbi:MAG TPA: hypothetical protein VH353_02490 [Caulobacteraceae bacterium]|nr:hypothetical protein [Caulobacteraceae bacterium]
MTLFVLAAVAALAQSAITTAPPVPTSPPPAAAAAPAAAAPAPAPAAAAAPTSGACADGPYRQFDFWVGDWTAYQPGGADVLAHVKVTRAADGCGLFEEITPVKGPSTAALIVYDPDATLWRRESVGGDGALLSLQGGMQQGEMDLEGEQTTAAGHGLARITWKVQGEVVSESAQKSTDGKDWTTWYDWDLRRPR